MQIGGVAALQMSRAVYIQQHSVSLLGILELVIAIPKTGLVSLKKCFEGGEEPI